MLMSILSGCDYFLRFRKMVINGSRPLAPAAGEP